MSSLATTLRRRSQPKLSPEEFAAKYSFKGRGTSRAASIIPPSAKPPAPAAPINHPSCPHPPSQPRNLLFEDILKLWLEMYDDIPEEDVVEKDSDDEEKEGPGEEEDGDLEDDSVVSQRQDHMYDQILEAFGRRGVYLKDIGMEALSEIEALAHDLGEEEFEDATEERLETLICNYDEVNDLVWAQNEEENQDAPTDAGDRD